MAPVPLVREIRSGLEESVHAGDLAVVRTNGEMVAWTGDPDLVLFARSSMKPVQAAVSLSLAPFDFSPAEVAIMCASHNAEPVHVAAVRSVLTRGGVAESALQCPPVRPWDEDSAAAAPQRLAINSDCSGKHAGMLSACADQGWPLETYRVPGHPFQQRVLRAVLLGSGLSSVHVGVDGCGVPVHGMPLRAVALIYARLGAPEAWKDLGQQVRQATQAMAAQPYLVAGRNRVDTALMQAAPGVLAKAGAEGLLCATVPELGLGIAVKVRDGTHRASGPAMIHALGSLGVLGEDAVAALGSFARPPVLGGGRPVGELVADFVLQTP
jgi:L-asparaginase II